MKKKELWLALSALGVAATTTNTALAAPAQVGVVNTANVSVEGQVSPDAAPRVLFVGSDIFRDETIRTDASGQVHLMFLDQSSLTIGPNSELVIDHFIYDPETNSGDLSISATKGILRFVGGGLSKKGNVTVKTPVGNLGIRGAVVLIDIATESGEVSGCILYGNELKGTNSESSISKVVSTHEQCVILSPDGSVKTEFITSVRLQQILSALQGPADNAPPEGYEVTLPDNYSKWLRELAHQDSWDKILEDEQFSAEILNRDIDNLAS